MWGACIVSMRGKREVRVYDYADLNVPMLARMFDRRCRGYESLGYTMLLPASAVPGWPVEVPLPIDPEWKRDYAVSVRRLIRDGVDDALGEPFCPCHPFAIPGGRGSRSCPERQRGFPVSPVGNIAGNGRSFPIERGAANSL